MSFKRNRQVFVEYRDQISKTSPIENRTYTMTHSDDTGDLFVTIGLKYAEDQTNEIQDQVYLKWLPLDGKHLLYGEVLIDSKDFNGNKQIRNEIFRCEMPLALQAIYTADNPFFEANPELVDTPVLIRFKSTDPTYDKLYNYGVMSAYNKMSRRKSFI